MNPESNNEIDMQMSSTTLGYELASGKIGAATALIEGTISKDRYTDLVVAHAQKAQEITLQEFPQATFSVSVLASAVSPEKLKDNIKVGSVDYPYMVDFNDPEVKKEKEAEVTRQGRSGLGKLMALGQEYAYAMLQSHSDKDQIKSTTSLVELVEATTPRLRTCIKTALDADELSKMKKVNSEVGGTGSLVWAIEPNRGVVKDFNQFMEKLSNVVSDTNNRYMNFGIDLDMGGLPEEQRSIFELLDILYSSRNDSKLLPVFVSLSGYENVGQGFRTHLPLGDNEDYAKKLGEWINTQIARGKQLPAFVVETNPAQPKVLEDYSKFLRNLKKGIA